MVVGRTVYTSTTTATTTVLHCAVLCCIYLLTRLSIATVFALERRRTQRELEVYEPSREIANWEGRKV